MKQYEQTQIVKLLSKPVGLRLKQTRSIIVEIFALLKARDIP